MLNGDKTDSRIPTYHQNCDPGLEYREMMDTKRAIRKLDGRQCYHIIQSFKPGEVTPELALEIAKEFAAEYLADYEVVIGTHIDKGHIHSHLIFNSVNTQTGEKYHITTQEYYRQIRGISDRLCREHGLSVIMEGQPAQTVSYIEWLHQSKGQPNFRSMLEADLRSAIEDASNLGHFFLLMEHKGWEISHGNRLGFRLRGQERFMIPSLDKLLALDVKVDGRDDVSLGLVLNMIHVVELVDANGLRVFLADSVGERDGVTSRFGGDPVEPLLDVLGEVSVNCKGQTSPLNICHARPNTHKLPRNEAWRTRQWRYIGTGATPDL